MQRRSSFALLLLVCGTLAGATKGFAGPSDLTQLAQVQPAPAQPGYIQQQPITYVQPAQAAPVIYQSSTYYQPGYYAQPYYAQPYYAQPNYARPYYSPYYAPVGVSLNFGYSRGHGHRHWR